VFAGHTWAERVPFGGTHRLQVLFFSAPLLTLTAAKAEPSRGRLWLDRREIEVRVGNVEDQATKMSGGGALGRATRHV